MKITRRQLRRIIKESAMVSLRPFSEGFSDIDIGVGIQEAIGAGFEEMKAELEDQQGQGPQISLTKPTGRVEVEWDFSGVEGFTDDGLSYDEAEAKAGLPPVVDIDPAIMAEYEVDAAEYGDEQAEQLITDWLSDELGWLHHGWSWV